MRHERTLACALSAVNVYYIILKYFILINLIHTLIRCFHFAKVDAQSRCYDFIVRMFTRCMCSTHTCSFGAFTNRTDAISKRRMWWTVMLMFMSLVLKSGVFKIRYLSKFGNANPRVWEITEFLSSKRLFQIAIAQIMKEQFCFHHYRLIWLIKFGIKLMNRMRTKMDHIH